MAANASFGIGNRPERYEPTAHATAEPTTRTSPVVLAPPPGWTRTAIPTKPIATPTSGAPGGRSPPANRSTTTSSGTDAITSEASPIGTSCSATKSSAFAPGRSTPIERGGAQLRA